MSKLRIATVIVFLLCVFTLIPGLLYQNHLLTTLGFIFLIAGLVIRLLRYLYMK